MAVCHNQCRTLFLHNSLPCQAESCPPASSWSTPYNSLLRPNPCSDPCLSAGVAVATVDKVGRRPLLLGGVGGLVLSLLALSGAQGLVKGEVATWVSVAGLLAYTASYQVNHVETPLSPPPPASLLFRHPALAQPEQLKSLLTLWARCF